MRLINLRLAEGGFQDRLIMLGSVAFLLKRRRV